MHLFMAWHYLQELDAGDWYSRSILQSCFTGIWASSIVGNRASWQESESRKSLLERRQVVTSEESPAI